MHGGVVAGRIRVAIPTQILEKYKKGYQLKFYYSDYPYTEKENYLLELGAINFEKTKLRGDEQMQEIDFEFPFQADKSQGSVLAQGYMHKKKHKNKVQKSPYFLIGKGIIQTAAMFREPKIDTLLYLPIEKVQISQPILFISFPKGSYQLPMDNTHREVLELLANRKQPITIEASCSPEGEEDENLQLAQKRAEAIKNILLTIRSDAPIHVHIHSHKEIVQEITNLLALKNFPTKQSQEIKSILQKSSSLKTLEKNFRQKSYYSQIVEQLYPSLRYVRLKVLDTTMQEPVSYYQLLIDSENSPIAHQNIGLWYWQLYQKGADSLALAKALYHLEIAANIEPRAEFFFNLMVIYSKLGNTNKNELFRSKLLSTDTKNLFLQEFIYYKKGLQAVQKARSSKDKKYRQALEFFEKSGNSPEAHINTALAALLSHQYDKAIFYLEKNKDEPLSLYLRAVVAARKGNEQEALHYLKKSLQADKSLKIKARQDLEFELLKENKAFLELLD
ncbi:MAG: hypothetical protein OHK0045_01050 [Raineya sp.]